MDKSRAFSPAKVLSESQLNPCKDIPDYVFDAVNALLCKEVEAPGQAIRLSQNQIIDEIIRRNPTITRSVIFERGYLNFEPAYRAQGWHVTYDKPGYCETYEAFFIFI